MPAGKGKKFIVFFVISFLLVTVCPWPAFAARAVKTTAPKTANFYLRWTLSDEEARALAKWDLVILDMEVQSNSPSAIRLMRQLNPSIVILAYITAAEIRSDAANLGEIAPLRRDLLAAIPDEWFLTAPDGGRRSFWSGTWIVNLTDRAPQVNGQRWNSYLPRFVKERVLASGLWDGVLYDNAWENISYFAGGPVDLNRDGRAEPAGDADRAWREGLKAIYRRTRELAPDSLVLENDGPLYAAEVNGLQFENFPNGGWSAVLARMSAAGREALAPKFVLVNANTANTGNRADFQKMRYGLGSAMLVDAYYGFDYGDQNHGQTWWYDEYEAALGRALAPASRVDGPAGKWNAGIWRRDFGAGLVIVNSGAAEKLVNLGADFERLHGDDDAERNDGVISSAASLPAADALLLLKPLGEVRGAAFPNGTFVRIFDAAGEVRRTGFFVKSSRFADSARLLTRVARGENREVIAAEGPRVRVFDENNRTLADFYPYGKNFRGAINIAAGDLDGDGGSELVTTEADSGGGRVSVFSLTGKKVREFRTFGDAYTGGAALAAGDLDGDGRAEIVVGAGPGGGPHLRIFDGAGQLLFPGFFAYAPKFRGGLSVAAGDLDGDGRAEIVVGAGPGGGPHVRVYNGKGKLKSEFFAREKTNTAGIEVGVADLEKDGKAEVLVFPR
ncbi:hypothetical protein EPN90_03435 [Patescibacteria group bacterium]|nr:MAG: hypothetical protein EPN90_03435 [Patescibacteria group bacterium]